MSDELSGKLLRLAQGVRDGRGAFLADAGGILVASAGADDRLDMEAAAAEYAGPLGEAASLCESRGWGRLLALTVQGAALRLTAAPTPTGLVVGLVGGAEALAGQMRRAAGAAAAEPVAW
jgi:predicted regulator of Ras-like GTPase activity (Roadblock/LC7/MglB family)